MDVDPSPEMSIVIVTYGTDEVVLRAIAAIAAHTTVAHEVIVVDNLPEAEPTGCPGPEQQRPPTRELLRRLTSGVVLIELDGNLGFGPACDLGAEAAGAEHVCFLNPDVLVGPGWAEPLLHALVDPVVAIAAPVLLDEDGTLQEAGQLLHDDGCTAAIGGPEIAPGDRSMLFARDIDYASAACWVVRRDEHLARGGFDPRFVPAFFEDVDLALRAEAEGRRTRLVVDVPVVHLRGRGGAGRDLALPERSQRVFRDKWAERLVAQLPRPLRHEEVIASRDRLVEGRLGIIAPSGRLARRHRAGRLEQARLAARTRPRDRVCFVTDDPEGLDLDGARRDGVEVLVGPVDRIVGDRPDLAAVWQSDPPASWRRDPVRLVTALAIVVVGIAGSVLRALVLRSPAGEMNADEAYTGLQARAIADGELAIVVSGNTYSAVIESYLLAPVLVVTGTGVLPLKMVPIVFWAIAALVSYGAGRYLMGHRVGLIAASLVWLAPGALLVVSTMAYVGYASGMAVVVATLWASAVLIDAERPDHRRSALLGALAGLGVYLHPMYLAVLVPLVVPTAWVHRASLRSFWVPFTAAGVMVNLPFLLWNAVNGWPSLTTQNALPGSYRERLEVFAVELVPRGYGLRSVGFDWVHGRTLGLLVYVLLVAAAVAGATLVVRRSERRSRWLLPLALVTVWPLMALFSPLIWSQDGRYNVISFPLVALAVAAVAGAVHVDAWRAAALGAAAVVLWAAVLVWPHADRYVLTARVDPNEPLTELVEFLEAHDVDRIAGSYWRVLLVEYATDRSIIGAVIHPFPVRFPERQRVVEDTPASELVFVLAIEADDPGVLWMPVEEYERDVVGRSVVYRPLPARS